MSLFNDLARLLVQYVDLKARQYTLGAVKQTRRVVSALAYFSAAGLFLAIGAAFVFISLFFRLSGMLDGYAGPAVVTGMVALVASAAFAVAGAKVMKGRAKAYDESPIAENRIL